MINYHIRPHLHALKVGNLYKKKKLRPLFLAKEESK